MPTVKVGLLLLPQLSACDEAEEGAEWGKGNSSWNKDNHNNNSIDWDEDPHHTMRWETLRKCNILLERLHEVPLDQGDPEFNTEQQVKLIL